MPFEYLTQPVPGPAGVYGTVPVLGATQFIAPGREGMLPDSYDLRAHAPDPVPIHPATLFPEAMQALGEPAMFDLRRLGRLGWIVHAPGPVRVEGRSVVPDEVGRWDAATGQAGAGPAWPADGGVAARAMRAGRVSPGS